MAIVITRQEIIDLLISWQSGKLDAKSVYDWANERYSTERWTAEDDIVNKVLSEPDTLDINLITAEDIPVFLNVLALPASQVDLAIDRMKTHAATFNLQARRIRCRNDPFYARFLNE